MLEEGKLILADKGYQGNPRCLTPYKGQVTPEESAFNDILSSVRILVECVIRRVKIFGVLGSAGRFHSSDFDKHEALFNVICNITNISFELEPVFSHVNYYLQT